MIEQFSLNHELTDSTTPGQSEAESNNNDRELHIPASLSDEV